MVVLSVDIAEKQGVTALHPAYLHQTKPLKPQGFNGFFFSHVLSQIFRVEFVLNCVLIIKKRESVAF